MKKRICYIGLYFVLFAICYFGFCFLIPGWRIKLAADPVTRFWAQLRHMAFFKAILSAVSAGGFTCAAVIYKKKSREK